MRANPILGQMDPRDTAGAISSAPSAGAADIGSNFLPLVGDAVGLVQDANMYWQDPESRRPLNYLLTAAGALPGIPAASSLVKKLSSSEKKAQAARAALEAHPTTKPQRILNKTYENEGYSVHVPTGKLPTEGMLVGRYANTDPRNTVIGPGAKAKQSDVVGHVAKNAKALEADDSFFGTWFNKEDGKTYFDVSKWFPAGTDQRKAVKFGEKSGQLSGYDASKGDTFPIGNWDEFIKSPEFHGRMNEMEKVGRDFLSNFAAKEWWDMHGSAFERVYGPESLDRLAGFIATTAPNRDPATNLRVASEYMRRYIKGEDVVQPNWRVPEGTQSRQAGTQIGMEKSFVKNFKRAEAGKLDELSADKVREEAQALSGVMDAVVLDRHWARISEDPARGILAAIDEGDISDPRSYQKLKEQVLIAAKKAGRPARDFSADVWTGIRETIRNKSELFGTKYKGSAIAGESMSYADHFEDLIQKKAKHMNITPAELEKRLRAGDATLLSLMIATPLGAAVYREHVRKSGADSQPST